jgi:hypothetical protein
VFQVVKEFAKAIKHFGRAHRGRRRQRYAIANEIVDGFDRIWNCKTWQVGILKLRDEGYILARIAQAKM